MNNKGFTLTELIVTIALLAVVMGIAFPAITKLQTENRKQVYETYEKALVTAAKLYVDKYDRDIWDNSQIDKQICGQTSGVCYRITYEHLRYEDLIKEFSGSKGEFVESGDTFVNATKIGNSVTYKVFLKIKKSNADAYESPEKISPCTPVDLPYKNE